MQFFVTGLSDLNEFKAGERFSCLHCNKGESCIEKGEAVKQISPHCFVTFITDLWTERIGIESLH